MDMYTLLYLKWITNKDRLYSTGNSAQCCVSLDGRGVWGRTDACVRLVESLGWKDPLEKGKATHSSIPAWRIPWTVSSMGSQRVGHD